jgi:hypothetical protein
MPHHSIKIDTATKRMTLPTDVKPFIGQYDILPLRPPCGSRPNEERSPC